MCRLHLVPLLLFISSALSPAAEVIDRIVVTVNGAAILQSDVDMAVRYEAFLSGRSLASVGATDWQASLQRLIDQELLRREMGQDFAAVPRAELSDRIAQLRGQIPGCDTDQGWRKALERYQLDADEVAERVSTQLQISRFIEQRLRPSVYVDPAAVQAFYRDKLLPELRQQGVKREPPLRQVRAQIEEILVQQRLGEELDSLLRTLREQARIRMQPENDMAPAKELRSGWVVQVAPGGGN
jgi:hypothetical protein